MSGTTARGGSSRGINHLLSFGRGLRYPDVPRLFPLQSRPCSEEIRVVMCGVGMDPIGGVVLVLW